MAGQLLRDDRHTVVLLGFRADNLPPYFRGVFGHSAIDLAVKIFNDFRTSPVPPDLRGLDLLSAFEDQRIGQMQIGRNFRFIKICSVRRFGVAIRASAQRSDVEQPERSLEILLGGQMRGRRMVAARGTQDQDKQEQAG